MKKSIFILMAIFALFSHTVSAEKIRYSLEKLPSSPFKLKRVGFYYDGPEAADLANRLGTKLENNGVTVVADLGISDVISKSDGGINRATREKLVNIMGDTGLIIVKTISSRPVIDRSSHEDSKGNWTFKAKLSYSLKMTVQLMDLKTGKTDKLVTLKDYKTKTNSASRQGDLVVPSHRNMAELFLDRFAYRAYLHYYPKDERKSIPFYADKYNDSKAAYKAFRAKDYDTAFSITEKALANAKAQEKIKAKVLARAYQNHAVSHFFRDNFDEAYSLIETANKTKKSKTFKKSMKLVNEAKQRHAAVKEWHKTAVTLGSDAPIPAGMSNINDTQLTQEEIMAKLQKYKKLLDQGLISQAVYDKKTAPFIDQLEL